MESNGEQAQSAVELLRLLAKTRKTFRLYEGENRVKRRLEENLAAMASSYLEQWGQCDLRILEHEIRLGDVPVYKPEDRTDNLAFVIFRDGIRQLSLLPGLSQDELHDLITAINRVSATANTDDDLVTLLWEHDFEHVRYVAIEELTQASTGFLVEEHIASPTLDGAAGGSAGERIDLEDLKRPVSYVPIETCHLSEEEELRLQQEIAADQNQDLARAVVELGIELTMLSGEAEEREALAQGMVTILDALLSQSGPLELLDAVAALDELAGGDLSGRPEVGRLQEQVLDALSTPARLEPLLEAVDDLPGERIGQLRELLRRLEPKALPALVLFLGRAQNADLRKVVTEVVAARGEAAVDPLIEHLEGPGGGDPRFLREVFIILRGQRPDLAHRIIEHLLQLEDLTVRKQAARALGPYREGLAATTWVALLDDDDEQMRMLAVTAMMRGDSPAAAEHLQRRVAQESFALCSAEEKRHVMTAIGKLAGVEAVSWFEAQLLELSGGMFTSRQTRETLSATAAGLAAIASPVARELFDQLSKKGNRKIRNACREAEEQRAGQG